MIPRDQGSLPCLCSPAILITTLTLIFYNWSLVLVPVQSPPTPRPCASATPRVRDTRTAARTTGPSAAARAPAGDTVTRCSYPSSSVLIES